MDQVTFDQLIGKPSGDLLQLMFLIGQGINPKPTFRATIRRINQGAFIGHQSRKRFNLILIDAQRIADTTFNRLHMLRMYRAVTGERFNFSAQPHTKADGIGGITNPDFFG